MSSAAPEAVGAMAPGDHLCVSFDSDAEQHAVAVRFVRDGLDNREKVAYFTDTEPATVLDFLAAGGITPGPNVEQGQLVVLPAEDSYLVDSPFDPDATVARLHRMVDEALTEGYAGLRVAGEMSWALRGGPGSGRLLEYERKVNEVFDTRPALALCQYDRRCFPSEGLAEFQAAHGGTAGPDPLYQDGMVAITPTYAPVGLMISGEVDMTNAPSLARALAAVAVTTEQDIYLDLSGLGFLDVAGVRTLAQATETLGDQRLVLGGLGYVPRTVLRLSGWDQLANLVVEDA